MSVVSRAVMIGGLALTMTAGPAATSDAQADKRNVQRVGLPPLLEALEATANCAGLRIDDRRFHAALASYGLSIYDLTLSGPFGVEVAERAEADRTRILDDRTALCSAARLRFVVDHGILKDAFR